MVGGLAALLPRGAAADRLPRAGAAGQRTCDPRAGPLPRGAAGAQQMVGGLAGLLPHGAADVRLQRAGAGVRLARGLRTDPLPRRAADVRPRRGAGAAVDGASVSPGCGRDRRADHARASPGWVRRDPPVCLAVRGAGVAAQPGWRRATRRGSSEPGAAAPSPRESGAKWDGRRSRSYDESRACGLRAAPCAARWWVESGRRSAAPDKAADRQSFPLRPAPFCPRLARCPGAACAARWAGVCLPPEPGIPSDARSAGA